MKNSKHWNRILTGAAAVSLAIGTMAPMAFAASATTQYNTRTMNVGSGFTAVVQGLVAQDQGHATEFLPIYYLMQGLGKLGYTVNWNGGTRTLNITTPTGVTVTAPTGSVGAPGANQMVIQLNGTSVMTAPRVVAKDPASGVMTTFAPIYYLNQALKFAGFTNTYNGQSWNVNGTAASQTGTLGSLTVSNASSGDGSAANPAVSLNGTSISVSTTLKDSSGNPLPSTAVTFNVSEYGNKPSQQPTVANASGTLIAPTTTSNADQYTVYTNSTGVAQIAITGPTGQTYAYELTASAPYVGTTSGSLTSAPAYVDFVANDTAGIAPYASATTPFSAALNTAVPITVTLPPNAAKVAQANVLLTLQVSGAGSFVSSTGQLMGSQIQVATNSSGVAQAAVTSANAGSVTVSVVASSLPAGVTAPNSTYISFGQAGIAAQVANYNITSNSVQSGQNVTVYGTLQDASGNAVPNGQVIVVGNDSGYPVSNTGNADSGDFGYVTTSNGTSSVTGFPDVGTVQNAGSSTAYIALSQGMNATSTVGDVITADSNGNFSFQITDTEDASMGTFSIYPVSNGQVASSTPLKSDTVTYTAGTTLASISLAGTDYQAQNNTITALTGLSANNHSFTPVYLDPQNAAGNPLTNTNLSYNVSVSNGGTVEGISALDANGNVAQTLSINSDNPGLSAMTIDETYNSTTKLYTFTVPGQTGSVTSASQDLLLYVYNGGTGATTLTVGSGSATATAAITFGGGAPTFVQSFSPATSTLASGQTEQITYQLQDIHGNPVPNGIATIASADANNPMWITQVNGVTLAQTENMGTASQASYNSEPTPIPFGTAAPSATGYSTVNIPGVVSWNASAPGTIQAYSNASGNVTLTVQASGVNYYVAPGTGVGSIASATNGSSTMENFYTYQKKGVSGVDNWQLYVGASAPTVTGQTPQELGTISFGNANQSMSLGSLTPSVSSLTNAGGSVSFANPNLAGGTYSISGGNSTSAWINATTGVVTVPASATAGTYTVTYTDGGLTGTGSFAVSGTTPPVNSTNPDFTTLPTANYVLGTAITGAAATNVVSINITDNTNSAGTMTGVSASTFNAGVLDIGAQKGDSLTITPVLSSGADTTNNVNITVQ